ncbi:MAG: lysine--tRNA ligase [Desulfurococcaceae archaeon]
MAKHWIDELADALYEKLLKRGKEIYVFNGGLSVSGLQHVGRLRGEIIITETLRKILSARGLRIKQYLTLYTQDAWKGKESQLSVFEKPGEAYKYKGWPLIRVPDPKGCHKNWVDHYWEDFGPFIKDFTDGEIEVITTTELYNTRLKEFVNITFEKRREVVKTVNKYRGRKPYSDDWIPFEPICQNCGRIDTTEAIRITDKETVEYVCQNCGFRGEAKISDGKLMWRIEWVGVWWALNVDFEPYGKDHAMPGGSRDSCVDLAINVYGIQPPEGLPYEWVELRTPEGKLADMGSSDFIGFTPRDWIEVAHPHVYRFMVLKTPPMKKYNVGLHEIPQYYNLYFKAERIYYGLEKAKDDEEEVLMKRSYELSYPRGGPPREMPEQVSYTHIAILAQILSPDKWGNEALSRLRISGHISDHPTQYGVRRILEMLPKSYKWVEKYSPPDMRFKLNTYEETALFAKKIPGDFKEILVKIYENLAGLSEWREDNIKNALMDITKNMDSTTVKKFYEYFYTIFVGKTHGPRIAPFLALLNKEEVLRYIKTALENMTY